MACAHSPTSPGCCRSPSILLAVLGLVLSLKPRSSMLRPVALAAAAAAAWVTILAIMVERGFTVIPRYLFMPAAFVAILAGIGMARAVESRRRHTTGSPRLAGAVVIAFGAAAALSVSEFRPFEPTRARSRVRPTATATSPPRSSSPAVRKPCSPVAPPSPRGSRRRCSHGSSGSTFPRSPGTIVPGPQIKFAYRGAGASSPIPAGAQVLATDDWKIVANCRDGRLHPFAHQRASSPAICSIADSGCCTQRDRQGILSTSHRSR